MSYYMHEVQGVFCKSKNPGIIAKLQPRKKHASGLICWGAGLLTIGRGPSVGRTHRAEALGLGAGGCGLTQWASARFGEGSRLRGDASELGLGDADGVGRSLATRSQRGRLARPRSRGRRGATAGRGRSQARRQLGL